MIFPQLIEEKVNFYRWYEKQKKVLEEYHQETYINGRLIVPYGHKKLPYSRLSREKFNEIDMKNYDILFMSFSSKIYRNSVKTVNIKWDI